MKKKGFTLLELLAVIIILAVIALIATPVVLNVVDEAKKSAFQDSSYGLIKSGEYYYTSQILNGGMTSDKVFNFPNNTELEFSGTEPESGYIKVTKEGLVEIAVSNGKYCATKGLNEEKVTIKDYVEGECVIEDNGGGVDEPVTQTIEIENGMYGGYVTIEFVPGMTWGDFVESKYSKEAIWTKSGGEQVTVSFIVRNSEYVAVDFGDDAVGIWIDAIDGLRNAVKDDIIDPSQMPNIDM